MPALDENCFNIYTDGSLKQKPRRGGFAYRYVLIDDDTGYEEPIDYKSACYPGVTNNQMELLACIEALKTALKDPELLAYLKKSKRVVIYTDSRYIQAHYQIALYDWKSSNWQKVSGGSVLNIGLWEELNKLRGRLYRVANKKLTFEKVKAHQKGTRKDPHNDAVDKLAKQAADSKTKCKSSLIPFVDVRRKNTENRVVVGLVKMCGQTIDIFIVTDTMIKKGLFRHCYKAISMDDVHYDLPDYANSSLPLRAGHYYSATFNGDQANPLILNAEEIDKPGAK